MDAAAREARNSASQSTLCELYFKTSKLREYLEEAGRRSKANDKNAILARLLRVTDCRSEDLAEKVTAKRGQWKFGKIRTLLENIGGYNESPSLLCRCSLSRPYLYSYVSLKKSNRISLLRLLSTEFEKWPPSYPRSAFNNATRLEISSHFVTM